MAYREQDDRMKRWYDRFASIDQGRLHDLPSDNYVDDIYAFFQNCYHLKDWIKNDNAISTPALKQSVEDCITSDRSLRLCADICNSLKHLTRTTSNRSGENPWFGQKQFAVDIGSSPTNISLKYQIDAAGGSIDAFQLATDCVAAWETFLKSEKLV